MAGLSKILLVDDNPVVLFKTALLLRNAGYEVIEASTGQEGIDMALEAQPDLVLLDVMLPDMNGVDVCRFLKSRTQLHNIFVVLLSYIETSSDRQVIGLEAGADGYIARPIENRELLARVESLMRLQRAESELRCAHAELERRVVDRTAELSRANLALRDEIEVRKQTEAELRLSRERLRNLALQLMEVQEDERRLIARELHDEVGQLLTNLKILLDLALREATDKNLTLIDQSAELTGELLGRIRQMSLDLRPQMLDDLGILPALEWLFKRTLKQTAIHISFKHSTLPEPLPKALETAAYRVIQGALTNVVRHASVKEATVRMWADSEALGIQVEDHGAGFNADVVLAENTSTGLSSMRERALLLGGQFTIESTPGTGTILTVELPLHSASPNLSRDRDPS